MPDDALALTHPEDLKLVTLARSARARARAAEGAALRDGDGRTYAGATVDLPSLSLTAVQVAVAMAVSGAAQSLETVVVLGDLGLARDLDVSVVRDFGGSDVPFHVAAADGSLLASVTT